MNLCTPALFYLILSIIAILIGYKTNLQFNIFIIKIIWMIVWVYLLNLLCSTGHTTISWILVLIPFILIAFMALMLLEVTRRLGKNN